MHHLYVHVNLGLAACAGQTVVPLPRRMHQPIEGCVVEARGRGRWFYLIPLTRFACISLMVFRMFARVFMS
jgi:hypothetical protein